jgi:hypothetical protein
VLWLIETHGRTCAHCDDEVSCDVFVSALEDTHKSGSGRVVLRYTSDHTLNHTSADTITHIGVTDSTGACVTFAVSVHSLSMQRRIGVQFRC